MLYTYKQCIELFNSDYKIKQAISDGRLYQKEKGIYSDSEYASDLAIISIKYPDVIITMNTAFYFHGLTDDIPEKYCIATAKSSRRLRDSRLKQFFEKNELLDVGVIKMKRRDATFNIYDKERMLIELLRNKNKLPYDYYKEILGHYRNMIHELNVERLQEYASYFPKAKMISQALEKEVF
jgi:hypothetical protein